MNNSIFIIFCLLMVTLTAEKVDFTKNFNEDLKKPIRVTDISNKFVNALEVVVNYTGEHEKNNSLAAFKYLQQGFLVLNNLTFNHTMPTVKADPTHRKAGLEIFFDTLDNVKNLISSRLIGIFRDFEHFHSATILYFVNKTVNSRDFQNNLETIKLYTTVQVTQAARDRGIHENIFVTFFERYKEVIPQATNCNSISLSRLLYNLYEDIYATIVIAYTIIISNYEFEHIETQQYVKYKLKQLEYLAEYKNTARNVKLSANTMISLLTSEYREYKNCNPKQWKEGENYLRVKNYVSTTLEIIQFNDSSYKTREEIGYEKDCIDYTFHSNFNDPIIIDRQCSEVFEKSPQSEECLVQNNRNNTFWMLGHKNWPVKCGYIEEDTDFTDYDEEIDVKREPGFTMAELCNCDKDSDQELSLRTVSLKEQLTDSHNNYVVTGIRFKAINNMIMIQVQEGKIVDGIIDIESLRWKTGRGKLPDDGIESVRLNHSFKSFNFDDIEVPYGHFVTGVRFKIIAGCLTLSIRGTEMWEGSRQWPSIIHHWHEPKVNFKEDRSQIDLKDFFHPAEVEVENIERSKSGRDYVSLTVGTLSNLYESEPVIPFFDAQEVVTNPPAPISGAGFYYKGHSNYGGFMAFKLFESKCIDAI